MYDEDIEELLHGELLTKELKNMDYSFSFHSHPVDVVHFAFVVVVACGPIHPCSNA